MSFKKVLIAVDSEPVAVHAAETGAELAQALEAKRLASCVAAASIAMDLGTRLGRFG